MLLSGSKDFFFPPAVDQAVTFEPRYVYALLQLFVLIASNLQLLRFWFRGFALLMMKIVLKTGQRFTHSLGNWCCTLQLFLLLVLHYQLRGCQLKVEFRSLLFFCFANCLRRVVPAPLIHVDQ